MKPDVQPVRFPNTDGYLLYGMTHIPEMPLRKKTAIVLLSPGVKMRVAPHRLYVKMADALASLGYPVLRFDFYGLGDSEGDVPEELLSNLYGSIQVGRYVDDTRCAMRWMTEHHGFNRFILAGLCGGAITGLLTARADPQVEGLLALGIPVILDSSDIETTKYISDGQINRLQERYMRKLFKPKAWLRFLTFQSDYRVVLRVLHRKLLAGTRKSDPEPSQSSTETRANDNTNPLFAPAFFDMISSKKRILLIFSGSDRLGSEYEEKFVNRHRARLKAYDEWFDQITLPEANHILSMPIWQEQMLDHCKRWLSNRFPD